MSFYYKLKISYDGRRYYGWQIQPDLLTVQGELRNALEVVSKGPSKEMAAGRTDAGVHALEQIVKVEIQIDIEPKHLMLGLNSVLPEDIKVLEISRSEKDFHPTVDAINKTYFYLFSNLKNPTPFQKDYIANITYKLDFELMEKACKMFVGQYDFKNYFCVGTEVNSTIREIYSCKLSGPHNDSTHITFPSYYKIEISSNGFLKQMVRLIVGTIWNVGRGKVTLDQLRESLVNEEFNGHLAAVAPSCGLYKSHVNY